MSREPSMEDILSSIRKVIAREDGPAPAPALARGEPEPDILELEDESPTAEAATEVAADDELVAHAAAAAARRSLDALSAAVVDPESAPAPSAAPASAGSRTLDDVVTEALRPMLKAWLDTNLPPLVEGMVAKEIARITGRRI
jgi:cell pole-organizing protein PopZ